MLKTLKPELKRLKTRNLALLLTSPKLSYLDWYRGSIAQIGGFEPYSCLVHLERLAKKVDFNKIWPTPGINFNDDAALALLDTCATYADELPSLLIGPEATRFAPNNSHFSPIDAAITYCILRRSKPKRVIEFGSGVITRIVIRALAANGRDGHPVESYINVDPEPDRRVRAAARTELGSQPRIALVQYQDTAASVGLLWPNISALQSGDALILKTAHIFRIDNELLPLLLAAVPAASKGVLVHFSDIYLPKHYPRRLYMDRKWFFTEQYFLQALLAHADALIEIVFASHYMLYVSNSSAAAHGRLPRAFGVLNDAQHAAHSDVEVVRPMPTSMWLRKVAAGQEEDDTELRAADAPSCLWRPINSWLSPLSPEKRSRCVYAL